MSAFDLQKFDVQRFDQILGRGLSQGLGIQGQLICIEADICEAWGLAHGDDPQCVAAAVRNFKITLNDSPWSTPQARAKGLRDLGLAQLGSLGVVDDKEFAKRLAEKTIRVLIPRLYRALFAGNKALIEAADRCEREGTEAAAWAAAEASRAAWVAARAAARASRAAWAARAAAQAAKDSYLILSADLALETLRELQSPGVALLGGAK
jgi:hypothetical protein